MRQVSLGPLPPGASTEQTLDWLIRAVREFENASTEDPIAVADSYSANATFTPTRQVNVTSPTAAKTPPLNYEQVKNIPPGATACSARRFMSK